jgi:hypothetical protein
MVGRTVARFFVLLNAAARWHPGGQITHARGIICLRGPRRDEDQKLASNNNGPVAGAYLQPDSLPRPDQVPEQIEAPRL